jgi:hypothetical protein
MRDRLRAAADQVEVGDFARAEHREAVEALGRQIDVPVERRRRRGDEEHALRLDESAHALVDLVVELAHGGRA